MIKYVPTKVSFNFQSSLCSNSWSVRLRQYVIWGKLLKLESLYLLNMDDSSTVNIANS